MLTPFETVKHLAKNGNQVKEVKEFFDENDLRWGRNEDDVLSSDGFFENLSDEQCDALIEILKIIAVRGLPKLDA